MQIYLIKEPIHTQIDTFIGKFNIVSPNMNDLLLYDGTSFINSDKLIDVLATIGPNYTNSSVAQNQVITPTYIDGTSGTIMYSSALPIFNTISAINCYSTCVSFIGPFAFGSTNVFTSSNYDYYDYNPGSGFITVYNIKLTAPAVISAINISINNCWHSEGIVFNCYASNSESIYNNSSWNATGMTFLNSYTPIGGVTSNVMVTVTNSNAYQYVHILVGENGGGVNRYYATGALAGIQIQSILVGYGPLVSSTDFTIATNTTNGYPQLTYTDASTIGCLINETCLLVEEAYRRLYPVVRDINKISLGTDTYQSSIVATTLTASRTVTLPDASFVVVGDTSTQTLTNKTLTDATNTITANGLRSATTTVSVSSATAPSSGQVLTATGSTTATWQTPTTGGTSLAGLTTDVTISAPANTQVLTYNSSSSKWINQTVPQRNLTYSRLKFLNKNHCTGSPTPLYTVETNIYAFIVDQTGVTANSALNLQSLTGNGTRYYYIQVLGTQGTYSIGLYFNGFKSHLLYFASQAAPASQNSGYPLLY